MRAREIVTELLLAFVVSVLMLPGALAFFTVLLALSAPNEGTTETCCGCFLNRTPVRIWLYSLLLTIGLCTLLAILVCRRFTRAHSACPGAFDQLNQLYDQTRTRLEAVCRDADTKGASGLCAEATEHLDSLKDTFAQGSQSGLPWFLGTGYLNAWRRLHAAEEAILFLKPTMLLLQNAYSDEARLEGSTIPQRQALLRRLRLAVFSLSQSASRYMDEAPVGTPVTDAAEARAALVQVRAAISEFRDGRREGLIRARNRLFATVVFAGIVGCIFLHIGILGGAPKHSIEAVSAIYLVGGIVGLIKQLQTASASEGASQDDYGLGLVRLIHTPLFSGLAAIGGVVLVKLTQGQGTTFSLSSTFNLQDNPYGLVAAAFFGLTPALLLSSLQHRIEQYKTDLSKSAQSDSRTGGSG